MCTSLKVTSMKITFHKAIPANPNIAPIEEYVAVQDGKVISYRIANGDWIVPSACWIAKEEVTYEQANKGAIEPFNLAFYEKL